MSIGEAIYQFEISKRELNAAVEKRTPIRTTLKQEPKTETRISATSSRI